MTKDIKVPHHQPIFILTCLTIFVSGASVDMFVPSLPAIATFFHVSNKMAGLIVTFYLLSCGISQLFAGSLCDSVGRSKVLTTSMFAYALITAMIPFCHEFNVLLLLRVLQGIFAAGIGVAGRSVLPDCYSGKTLAKRSTYYTLSWSTGPVLSPFIGGYLQVHFGWRASFYCLAGYAFIVALLLLKWFFETVPNKHTLRFKTFLGNYKTVLQSSVFFYATLLCGLAYGFITAFNVSGPFLIETVLHYSPIVYGHIALMLGIAWMLGNMACRLIISGSQATLYFSLNVMLAIVLALISLLLALFFNMTLWSVSTPAILLMFCGGVLFPLGFSRCLSYFPQIAGSASAAMGAMYSVFAGSISALATFTKASTAINVSIIFLMSALFIALFFFLLTKEK